MADRDVAISAGITNVVHPVGCIIGMRSDMVLPDASGMMQSEVIIIGSDLHTLRMLRDTREYNRRLASRLAHMNS